MQQKDGLNDCKLNCLAKGYRMFRSFGFVLDRTACGKNRDYQCKAGRCILFKDKVRIGFNFTKTDTNLQKKFLSPKYSHFPPVLSHRQKQQLQLLSKKSKQRQIRLSSKMSKVLPSLNQSLPYRTSTKEDFGYVFPQLTPAQEEGRRGIIMTTFKWQVGGISRCTRYCGGGEQTIIYRCFEEGNSHLGKFVDDSKCIHVKKPPIRRRACNQLECTVRWSVSNWTACSETCGENSTQYRSVLCKKVRYRDNTVVDGTVIHPSLCQKLKKPIYFKRCLMVPCYFQWETESWSECSASCNYGTRKRNVVCKNHRGFKIKDENCNLKHKPNTIEACMGKPCSNTWFTSEWSPCSSACSNGYQMRRVVCASFTGVVVPETLCNETSKPRHRRVCVGFICATRFWVTTKWSKCTNNCGVGEQYRQVLCMEKNDQDYYQIGETKCPEKKPVSVRTCRNAACLPLWYTDHWKQCTKPCGEGQQYRHQICLSEKGTPTRGCVNETRSHVKRACNTMACSLPRQKTLIDGDNSSEKEKDKTLIDGDGSSKKTKDEILIDGDGSSKKTKDEILIDGDKRSKKEKDEISIDGDNSSKKTKDEILIDGDKRSKKEKDEISIDGDNSSEKEKDKTLIDGDDSSKKTKDEILIDGDKRSKKEKDEILIDGDDSSKKTKDEILIDGDKRSKKEKDEISIDGDNSSKKKKDKEVISLKFFAQNKAAIVKSKLNPNNLVERSNYMSKGVSYKKRSNDETISETSQTTTKQPKVLILLTTQPTTTVPSTTIISTPTTSIILKTRTKTKVSIKKINTFSYKRPTMHVLRPFANFSRNKCYDLHRKAYCHVISVRLKFCKIPRFQRLCCHSCKQHKT
ncbi:papilin-like isoform X2 [Hydractinia symbiolongicarpus]|uniref:papilin-like isoform X2 n=1 Tax=Hydractinia symbiolongicarpus TaxID=13093 RepID=UPI00254A2020|nr:papilin-like isoform X2 [Hydractinia symbiolongicarpus]